MQLHTTSITFCLYLYIYLSFHGPVDRAPCRPTPAGADMPDLPDYIRIDTAGLDTFTTTQQMNIESVVTVGAIISIIAGIIVVVFVL